MHEGANRRGHGCPSKGHRRPCCKTATVRLLCFDALRVPIDTSDSPITSRVEGPSAALSGSSATDRRSQGHPAADSTPGTRAPTGMHARAGEQLDEPALAVIKGLTGEAIGATEEGAAHAAADAVLEGGGVDVDLGEPGLRLGVSLCIYHTSNVNYSLIRVAHAITRCRQCRSCSTYGLERVRAGAGLACAAEWSAFGSALERRDRRTWLSQSPRVQARRIAAADTLRTTRTTSPDCRLQRSCGSLCVRPLGRRANGDAVCSIAAREGSMDTTLKRAIQREGLPLLLLALSLGIRPGALAADVVGDGTTNAGSCVRVRVAPRARSVRSSSIRPGRASTRG